MLLSKMGSNKNPLKNTDFAKPEQSKLNNAKLEREVKAVRSAIEKLSTSLNGNIVQIISLLTKALENQDKKIEELKSSKTNQGFVPSTTEFPPISTPKEKNTISLGTGQGKKKRL